MFRLLGIDCQATSLEIDVLPREPYNLAWDSQTSVSAQRNNSPEFWTGGDIQSLLYCISGDEFLVLRVAMNSRCKSIKRILADSSLFDCVPEELSDSPRSSSNCVVP